MINTLVKVLSKQQFGFVTKQDLDVLEVEMPNRTNECPYNEYMCEVEEND